MNGTDFQRLVRKLARQRGIPYQYSRHRGKGSHGTLYYGDRRTTVNRGEIGEGLLTQMLKQLGLTRKDLGK